MAPVTTNSIPRTLSSSSLTGTEVQNPQGENLGELKELMIDLGSGRVAYAVVSFGGFLGLGDKLFAVPWDSFQVDTESEVLLLDVDKSVLENAPGFDKDNWPDTTKPDWLRGVYHHYGSRPYWE